MSDESTDANLVELLRTQLEAANRHDLDAFMSLCHPSGVYDASRDGVGVFDGPSAIRGLMEDWWGAFEDLTLNLDEVRNLGGGITFSVVRHDGRPMGSTGHVQTRQAYVIEWVDGFVALVEVYGDIDEGRAAAARLAASKESPMSEANVEVVRRLYDAWARNEVPGPPELLDPDIEYVNPVGAIEPGTRRGLPAFIAAIEKLFEGWATWKMEPEQLRAVGDQVAVMTRYRATARRSGIAVNGRESALLTLRDGKVVRYEWFHGPRDALDALGLSE